MGLLSAGATQKKRQTMPLCSNCSLASLRAKREALLFSVSLSLARQRPLALDDFEQLDSPTQTLLKEETLPGPYWEPKMDILPRQRSFLGRILRDFAHTWRHVLRRQMNTTAFVKLAYANL
ncbi:hypothetical protein NW759_004955 [Fusarium solani]|nr:hypothetical protein NW759_004955 [Fusarium solani]